MTEAEMVGFEVAEVRAGGMGARDLRDEIGRVIAAAQGDPSLGSEMRAALGALRDGDVRVNPRTMNLGAETLTALVIVLAGWMGEEATKTVWQEVVWPRLKRRFPGLVITPPPEASEEGKAGSR